MAFVAGATAKKLKLGKTPQQRVEFLVQQRRKIALTNWNALTPMFGGTHDQVLVERDAELVAAIMTWQQRRLAEIDEQLRQLGVADVEALEAALDKIREDHHARQMAAIEAAMSSEPFMLILPEREEKALAQ